MVNYPHNNLFNRGDTDRQLRIDFTGGTITNKEMHQGSFSLKESLCSEERLAFGTCESSVLSFKVHNVLTPLVGKELTVYEVLNGNTAEPFQYGKYKVQSDKPTADRRYRDVVAYDAMYDILNADVASWYNSLTFPCSIGYFRKKFLSYLKVDYVDTELVNDGIYIQKTVEVEQLSGKQVINAICEINGCFGHINRQGKFEFVVLEGNLPGLLPSTVLYPSKDLYPFGSNEKQKFAKSSYISCKYEDFETQQITGLQIRQEENDIGAIVGTPSNLYVIQDNFLVYGKNNAQLVEIANNALSVMSVVYYRPIDNLRTSGKPYLEVGDRIAVSTNETMVQTYILERVITGLNGQKDTISANGVETYGNELNGIQNSIIQLKGKTNKLTRTVDETKLMIEDVNENLSSEIRQTAGEISLKVSKGEVISEINQSSEEVKIKAERIELEGYTTVNNNFSIDEDGNATIANENYILQMTPTGLNVTDISRGLVGEYSATAITHAGIQWANIVNAGMESQGLQQYVMLGHPAKRVDGYFTFINGYEPVTLGNIGSYIQDIAPLQSKIIELEERIAVLEEFLNVEQS